MPPNIVQFALSESNLENQLFRKIYAVQIKSSDGILCSQNYSIKKNYFDRIKRME